MNKIDLHFAYKAETGTAFEPMETEAYFKRHFNNQAVCDIVLDAENIDPRIIEMIDKHLRFGAHTTIEFIDPDYHKWCEEKLMELLK